MIGRVLAWLVAMTPPCVAASPAAVKRRQPA
jgi:hypothetical protein